MSTRKRTTTAPLANKRSEKKTRTRPETFRECLHQKVNVYGTCCISTSPVMPKYLASVGIDCVFIDTEHVPIPRDTLSWMCQLFSGLGVLPIARVPEPEPYRVCEYIDAGACGIVAPYLETVQQVKDLIGATKLRPIKGAKLKHILDNLKPITPESGADTDKQLYEQVDAILGETKTSTFMKKKNAKNVLLLNIESVTAVENLERLVEIPGVNGLLVGPHDLSCNFAVPEEWTSDVFHNAIGKIIDVSNKFNVGCGIHYSFVNSVEYQAKWSARGANIVMHSADVKLVAEKLQEDFAKVIAANGDTTHRLNLGDKSMESV